MQRNPVKVFFSAAAVSMLLLLFATALIAKDDEVVPVKKIASRGMVITTESGEAELPVEISRDWNLTDPEVTRALITIHGMGRDVEDNFQSAKLGADKSDARASTIIIAPQFLREVDIPASRLGPKVLRWSHGEWTAGENAMAPMPLSSFSVLDAIVLRLGDRQRFPALQQIVIAGHSAGGQFVQRYAVVGHAPKTLSAAGIHVRFVVANPSSFLYFDDMRPAAGGTLAPFAGRATYNRFNRWKYGPRNAPDYIGDVSFESLEKTYAASDVIYLQGTADVDPNHPELDKTCAAEAQGANRFERGNAYFRYMNMRHPDSSTQQFWQVPNVAHDESKMFNSQCGLAALSDHGKCTTPMH
jgi:hypothetical protein